MAAGNEACDQVDREVDRTTMARMFDLRDVFELIRDGLNDCAFALEEFIGPAEETVVHLLPQFGYEVQTLGHQQLLGKGLGEIAFIPKELADEACGQLGSSNRFLLLLKIASSVLHLCYFRNKT